MENNIKAYRKEIRRQKMMIRNSETKLLSLREKTRRLEEELTEAKRFELYVENSRDSLIKEKIVHEKELEKLMADKLPGRIKDFLNSVSANNQVIGVNLALQNGYTAEDVARYVLNTSTGWSKRTFNPARNLIIITCKKSFLGKRITTRAKFHTEEPLESEIYIRLGRWHRGSIYRQRGAEKPYYPERTEALMLDGLVKLIKSEIFEPA